LYYYLVEFIKPINCILTSENVPSITIVLSERRSNGLKGNFFIDNNKTYIYTHSPTKNKPARWSFEKKSIKFYGEMILLKDSKIWHQYQNKIQSNEVNKVLFSGLATKLSKITNNNEILNATSGFFKIGNECYGGKVNRV
tara:strand:+ start:381 stop:800 length:420 start_codon:yes stop_codon:yes gene_type:complete